MRGLTQASALRSGSWGSDTEHAGAAPDEKSAEEFDRVQFEGGKYVAFKAGNGRFLRVDGGELKATANASNSRNARFEVVSVDD